MVFTLVTGCHRAGRIREHRELFQALPAREQDVIRRGLIEVGFTREMVAMALGKPNHIEARPTSNGTLETWMFRNYILERGGVVQLPVNNLDGPRESSGSARPAPTLFAMNPDEPQSAAADLPEGMRMTVSLLVDFMDGRVAGVRVQHGGAPAKHR